MSEALLREKDTATLAGKISESLCLSRYVGIITIETDDIDKLDLLLDTTSTLRNLECLAIIQHGTSRRNTRAITEGLSKRYGRLVLAP